MGLCELEGIGVELCRDLLNQDYENIAQRLGYAIAFKKAAVVAIKEDFERSLLEPSGILELAKFNVAVRFFPDGTSDFISLVECRFSFDNSNKKVLAEIIQNESGFYLEQISCET